MDAFLSYMIIYASIAALIVWYERARRKRADLDAQLRMEEIQEELDMPKTTLTDGSPVTPDHRELKPDGQQKGYVVLSEEERAKGFVRPLRNKYIHKTCGGLTQMHRVIAETYARDPKFYDGTFCAICRKHFPLDQFVWDGTDITVGS